MPLLPQPPEPIKRPFFAFWLWQRGVSTTEAGRVLSCSGEQVRRYCLPFGHGDRVIPPESTMSVIVDWTRGDVVPGDFYPGHLRGDPAQLRLARAE